MSKKSLGATLLAACLLPVAGLASEGMQIEPGNWTIENERTATVNGRKAQPMKTSDTRCMGEALTVADLSGGEEAQDNSCSNEKIEISADHMKWSMVCDAPGGKAKGSAEYRASDGGKKVKGTTTMKVSGRMKMVVENHFVGTHQGPCD